MTANLVKCESCDYSLISEELPSHKCKRTEGGRTDNGVFYVSDGEREYPLKLTDEFLQRNK